jgi:hypothetical protein
MGILLRGRGCGRPLLRRVAVDDNGTIRHVHAARDAEARLVSLKVTVSSMSSSTAPDNTFSTSEGAPPSHEDFLNQLEGLFGSKDPDFDHFASLLHRRYEERKDAGEEEAANTIWKVHRVPLDVAYEASERWDELDGETKRSVYELLQTYEQKLEALQQAQKLNE